MTDTEKELRRQRHRLMYLKERIEDAQTTASWATTAWLSFKCYGEDDPVECPTSAKLERQFVNLASILDDLDESVQHLHVEVLRDIEDLGVEADPAPRALTFEPREGAR